MWREGKNFEGRRKKKNISLMKCSSLSPGFKKIPFQGIKFREKKETQQEKAIHIANIIGEIKKKSKNQRTTKKEKKAFC